jgi:intron-binding protein aquarius
LGIGEKDLETSKDYSKYGRVNYMLERRMILLREIKKLSDSLGVNIYHEFTCETAEIFYKYHVQSRWEEYSKLYLNRSTKPSDIADKFPFSNYILKTLFLKKNDGNNLSPSELFHDTDQENNILRSNLYWDIIENIFEETSECRGFELIRNNRERGNYLVSKLSKVIAMTSTHAALKRKDLIEHGFEFDNIIVEEAGQLLEIDAFIPLTLHSEKSKTQAVKRIILIGI